MRAGRIFCQEKIGGVRQDRIEEQRFDRRAFIFELQRPVTVEPWRHLDFSGADEVRLLRVARHHSRFELGEAFEII